MNQIEEFCYSNDNCRRDTLVRSRRGQSLLHWIQPQTHTNLLWSCHEGRDYWHTCVEQKSRAVRDVQMAPNLTAPESQCTLCTGPARPTVTRQRLSELTATPSPSGPLTSHCNGSIEAICWGCWKQFAVSPGWTPRNALFLLQYDPISPWTAQSLPADQPGLPCPACVGQEGGKRDCCQSRLVWS